MVIIEDTKMKNRCIPVKKDGLFGFIDENGNWIIPPKYKDVGCDSENHAAFADGLALVQSNENDLFGFIDIKGTWIIEPKFSEALPFAPGTGFTAAKGEQEGWGVINKLGNWVIEPRYENCSHIIGDRYFKLDKDWTKLFYYFDAKDGKLLIDGCVYEKKRSLSEIAAGVDWLSCYDAATDDDSPTLIQAIGTGLWGFIDYNNTADGGVIYPRFKKAYPFSNGLALVQSGENELYGFINRTGEYVVRPEFKELFYSTDGMFAKACSKDNGQWGIINLKGEWVLDPIYTGSESIEIPYEECGTANGLRGYKNHSGKWIIKPLFLEIGSYEENGMAVAKCAENELWGFINLKGEWVIEPQFESDAENFEWSEIAPEWENGLFKREYWR